ncbi:MAG TPA: tRNA (N6-isopentenyl adenosine(37)-C2)-methylthiotransferase MiaB [bacterium]|nr:tRNA (N6-isopentenyl adenosine(37)-C2)-methylthiotransferase MiaB [bacterium]
MKYYLETYGCQMNEADSEIVASIIERYGYQRTDNAKEADMILVNSCSVRENAEDRAIARLAQYKGYKKNDDVKLGLLGCVPARGKEKLQQKYDFIDILLGPDSYRKFDEILDNQQLPYGHTQLSKEELYDDVEPHRDNDLNAWISIMRGCNQFCSYCIVPFTRGRERSRPLDSILKRARNIAQEGIPQITLLGQNVNAYNYEGKVFSDVLEGVAQVDGIRRIRFMSPHPSDFTTEMLKVMGKYDNICNHIHLPLQSGSTKILEAMNRTYTKEEYLELANEIKTIIPGIALTTDVIVGFPGESDQDFADTIDVMKKVEFDNAFMFQYSPRPGTYAARNLEDNIPYKLKNERLQEVIKLQHSHTRKKNRKLIGQTMEVLVEGPSKKDPDELVGRTESDKLVIMKSGQGTVGQFSDVKITETAGVSLFGEIEE